MIIFIKDPECFYFVLTSRVQCGTLICLDIFSTNTDEWFGSVFTKFLILRISLILGIFQELYLFSKYSKNKTLLIHRCLILRITLILNVRIFLKFCLEIFKEK